MSDHGDALDPDEKAMLEAWLAESGATDVVPGDLRGEIANLAERRRVEVDEALRALGYDYKDRDRIRRGKSVPRPKNARYRDVNRKRYEFYISQIVDWDTTSLSKEYVTATWFSLTGENLELAQRWWNAGMNPLALEQIAALVEQGWSPADLAARVKDRSVVYWLNRGATVEWCVLALGWSRKSS
jgi:hypothetical protein